MFYREDEIKNNLICPRCENIYVEPKTILPCLKTLCVKCVVELCDGNEFECSFCRTKHPLPEGGFPPNSIIESFLRLQPKQVHRNNQYTRELANKLGLISSLNDTYSQKVQQIESKLDEHCADLARQIDLSCEQKIQQIHVIRERHLKTVDDYRKTCSANIERNKSELNKPLDVSRKYVDNWNTYLKGFEIDDELIQEQFQEADFHVDALKLAINNVESVKFDGHKLTFQSNNAENFGDEFVGKFTQVPIKRTEFPVNLKQQKIASASSDGKINIWQVENGECIQNLTGHSSNVRCITMADSRTLVSASDDRTLKVWNLDNGRCVRTLNGHSESVFCVVLINRTTVASASFDKTIKIWNFQTGECTKTFEAHTDQIWCLCAIDQNRLVSGSRDRTLKVWHPNEIIILKNILKDTNAVRCVTKLDNAKIVSGNFENKLKIWNIESGTCLATLTGHTDAVMCVLVIDAKTLASGSRDKTIKVWKIDENEGKGACVQTLKEHEDMVKCFCLIKQNRFVSGSNDKKIKVWNWKNFKCEQTLVANSADISSLVTLI